MAPRRTDPRLRFASKIETGPHCWEWRGTRSSNGYGAFHMPGGKPMVPAHRYSYEMFVGPITPGLFVLHLCDNRGCVNPEHLAVGDQSENLRQCRERGRANTPRGEQHGNAVLTEDDVRAIRDDPRTLAAIAADHGIDFGTVGKIKRRTRWAHVA